MEWVVLLIALLIPALKAAWYRDVLPFSTLVPYALGYLYLWTYMNPFQNALTLWVDSIYQDRDGILLRAYIFFAAWIVSLGFMLLN